MIILFKYYANMKNFEIFRGFGYIYKPPLAIFFFFFCLPLNNNKNKEKEYLKSKIK